MSSTPAGSSDESVQHDRRSRSSSDTTMTTRTATYQLYETTSPVRLGKRVLRPSTRDFVPPAAKVRRAARHNKTAAR